MRTNTHLTGATYSSSDVTARPAPESSEAQPRFAKFLNRVAQLLVLLEQRHGDVSAEEMTEIIGCQGRQARKIFHFVVGETFRSAQLRCRLTPARPLVQNTSFPIAWIAARFGYSRRAKFDQSYTSLFNVTPAADRLAADRERAMPSATQGVDSTGWTDVVCRPGRNKRHRK